MKILFLFFSISAFAQVPASFCVSTSPLKITPVCPASQWGSITGSITNQIDLTNALAAKLNANSPALVSIRLAAQCPIGQYSDGVGCLPLPTINVPGVACTTLASTGTLLAVNLGNGQCIPIGIVNTDGTVASVRASHPFNDKTLAFAVQNHSWITIFDSLP